MVSTENIRIIPRLDIKGPNLVKGVHLEGLRVLGTPEIFARHYYENGADEIVFMDVVASLYGRNSLHDIIAKTAREIFIPLTVGGGIRTTDDIRDILRSGADKVAINTAAVENPDFIRNATRKFGSSTISIAIEAIRQPSGTYIAFTNNGRENTGLEVCAWARQAEQLGAGELIITSVDREGTGKGFDLQLLKMITESVTIPVVAHGGAGTLAHIESAVREGGVSAVALASILHYGAIEQIENARQFTGDAQADFLKNGRGFSKVDYCSLQQIKEFLCHNGISCRR